MNIHEIKDIFNKGLDIISNPNDYKNIIDMRNNLYRLDTINRVLVYVQNKDAFDIKSRAEWSIQCRDIMKRQKPIYLIMPKYKTEYIDCESGEELINSDLSIDELNKALEYGVVVKKETISNTYIEAFYDIRQTKSLNGNKYSINKPILSTKKVLELLVNITNCSVEESELDYYSNSENKLYISKQSYSNVVNTVSKIIKDYYIKRLSDNNIIDTSEFSEYDNELLDSTIIYSIKTLLCVNNDNNSFDIVRNTSKKRLLDILNINNIIIIDIAEQLDFNNTESNNDLIHNNLIIKKAEVLLNIMEANNINKIMKGA